MFEGGRCVVRLDIHHEIIEIAEKAQAEVERLKQENKQLKEKIEKLKDFVKLRIEYADTRYANNKDVEYELHLVLTEVEHER